MFNQIGRRIYFDKISGEIILNVHERIGFVIPTTIEQDIQTYKTLSERNRDTFDYIELEYGQYAQDFAECNGYRINVDDKTIEFSYPDDNEEPIEPVYQAPLSEQVEGLKKDKQLLQIKVDALSNQNEMIEGAIAELAAMTLQ